MPLKKKNIIAAERGKKSKKPISKGLQAEVISRLQNKGLTTKMCHDIIQSTDDYLAEKMVEALQRALEEEERAQKAS